MGSKSKRVPRKWKSQRVWSRENSVNRSTLRYWIERLDELSDGDEVKFAEVEIGGERIC